MHTSLPRFAVRLIGLAALLGLATAGRAQTVAPAAASSPDNNAAAPAQNNSVVTLSPFQVTADQAGGYVASESVTGTRIASKIRDLPFQVNVVTSDFLKDFGLFDLSQQLGYVSNVSPSDTDGTFTLRGFSSTPYVDGFRRLNSLDISDVQRIEIIKGPSASIYGQTLPGGVVNYITRQPKTTPEQDISLTYGSDDFLRATASSTGPVGNSTKLFYLADVSTQSTKFAQQYSSQHTSYGTVSLLYRPDDRTNITLKVDDTKAHNHDRTAVPFIKSSTKGFLLESNGTTPLPYSYYDSSGKIKTANAPYPQVINRYATNPADIKTYLAYIANPSAYPAGGPVLGAQLQTTNSWDSLAYNLANLRSNGPLGYTNYEVKGATVTAEHVFNDVFSTRGTLDLYDRPYQRLSSSGNQVYYTDPNYPDGELGLATPTWALQPRKGQSVQIDNLAAFDTGPVSHKLLLTLDYTGQQQGNTTLQAVSSGTNATTGQPVEDFYLVTDPATGLQYPYVLPLGPRSTGSLRYNTKTNTYTPGAAELTWPLTDASYMYPTYAQNPAMYSNATLLNYSTSNDYGVFLSERASFFKGRLLALIGGRYDFMSNMADNYLATDQTRHATWTNHAFTHQAGLTAYATKNIVLFANQSTTYNPNPQIVNVHNPDGSYSLKVLPNETGSGYEYGARFSFFNQRLNFGISRFDIDRKNKVDSFTNEFGITEYVGSGEQRSRGYELDFNWSLTDSFQILGGYGYNDARYAQSSLPYLVGTNTPQNAKDNLSVALRYQIRHGALKGLSFISGVRDYSRSLVNVGSGGVISTNPYATGGFHSELFNVPLVNGTLPFTDLPSGVAILSRNDPNAKDPVSGLANKNLNKGVTAAPAGWVLYTPGTSLDPSKQYYVWDGDGSTSASYSRTTSVDDGRSTIFNNPYIIWTFGVNYTFKTGGRLRHTLRFTVNNAFNKFYTYGNAVVGLPRQYQGSYSISF